MDPISLAIGAVGLGLSIFGGMKAAGAAHEQAENSQKISALSSDEADQEQHINDLKQQQMEIEARRSSIQTIRNANRAHAMGLNASVSQGANMGSGIQGGFAQVAGDENFGLTGINDALQIGRGINTFNTAISGDKRNIAGLQGKNALLGGDIAQDQGIASIGGAMMKAGPIIGQVSQGFGGGGGGLAAGRAFNNSLSSSYYGPLN